jgi:hypothetical protein
MCRPEYCSFNLNVQFWFTAGVSSEFEDIDDEADLLGAFEACDEDNSGSANSGESLRQSHQVDPGMCVSVRPRARVRDQLRHLSVARVDCKEQVSTAMSCTRSSAPWVLTSLSR